MDEVSETAELVEKVGNRMSKEITKLKLVLRSHEKNPMKLS